MRHPCDHRTRVIPGEPTSPLRRGPPPSIRTHSRPSTHVTSTSHSLDSRAGAQSVEVLVAGQRRGPRPLSASSVRHREGLLRRNLYSRVGAQRTSLFGPQCRPQRSLEAAVRAVSHCEAHGSALTPAQGLSSWRALAIAPGLLQRNPLSAEPRPQLPPLPRSQG